MRINDYYFDATAGALTLGEKQVRQNVAFAGTVVMLDSGVTIKVETLEEAQELSAAFQWIVANWTGDDTKIYVPQDLVDVVLKTEESIDVKVEEIKP